MGQYADPEDGMREMFDLWSAETADALHRVLVLYPPIRATANTFEPMALLRHHHKTEPGTSPTTAMLLLTDRRWRSGAGRLARHIADSGLLTDEQLDPLAAVFVAAGDAVFWQVPDDWFADGIDIVVGHTDPDDHGAEGRPPGRARDSDPDDSESSVEVDGREAPTETRPVDNAGARDRGVDNAGVRNAVVDNAGAGNATVDNAGTRVRGVHDAGEHPGDDPEPDGPTVARRVIPPPLRRWATTHVVRRDPSRWGAMLGRANELSAAHGAAIMAGLMDALDALQPPAQSFVANRAVASRDHGVRRLALRHLAQAGEVDRAYALARNDPNRRIRDWADGLRQPPPGEQPHGNDSTDDRPHHGEQRARGRKQQDPPTLF